MVIRSAVLEQQYMPEYDVGLWAFGTTQVLKDRKTGSLRTCKTVVKSLIGSPRDAFHRLGLLQDLQHPHICGVVDVLEDYTHIFVVSEKPAGADIGEWVAQVVEEDSWVQEETVAQYVRQALIALAHSHSNGVYHRDLRPGSLALTSRLPDAGVKVCDFGLLPILDPQAAVAQKGPSPYTAPELLTCFGRASGGHSDVWSIGAIAHALLVGRPPYHEESAWSGLNRSFLSRRRGGGDAWADRSAMSRSFVQHLLQQAGDRPTAARALQHPWLKGVVGLEAAEWGCENIPPNIGAADATRDVQRRLLCYMLAVLLVPILVQPCDLHQLRGDFVQADADLDGLVSTPQVRRILVNRGAAGEVATAIVDIIDVRDTGVFDLCAALCADLIAREFGHDFKTKGHMGRRRDTAFGAKDLAPQMLRRFFASYGDSQQLVTAAGISARWCHPTVRDMELHANVCYRDILGTLPGDMIDNQILVAELTEHAGLGTPLDVFAGDDHKHDGNFWADALNIEGLSDFVSSVFQTCSIGIDRRQPQGGHERILAAAGFASSGCT